jgi:nucleotide-binding universal stress UspA family protein
MKTIVVPIDFSKATAGVIDAAASLASATDGRIVLLHVVQPLIITSDYGLTMDNFKETVISSEKHAARRLAELGESLRAKGIIKVETAQISGPSRSGIVEQAKILKADYIVMGSHGHTAFYDLVIGSTTQYVVNRAHCPVVIVPRAK